MRPGAVSGVIGMAHPMTKGTRMFRTILAATDGSEHSGLAVSLAADLAEKYDARLVLLNVVDNRELTPAQMHLAEIEYGDILRAKVPGARIENMPGMGFQGVRPVIIEYAGISAGIRETLAEGILKKAEARAKAKGARAIETRVEFGDAAPSIIAVAKEIGADLIVLGSRGLSDLKGLLLGSVSHKVANLAEVPVITVK
jgi:nucleotide-binding universal stress UspA family protein